MDQRGGHRRRHRVRQSLVQPLGARHQVRGHRRHRAGPPAELVAAGTAGGASTGTLSRGTSCRAGSVSAARSIRAAASAGATSGSSSTGSRDSPPTSCIANHAGSLSSVATMAGTGTPVGASASHDAGLAQHVVSTDRLLARWHRLHHQRTLAGLDPVGQARVAAGQPREESHLHVRPLTAQRRRDALAQPALVDLGAHDRGSRGRPRTRSAMMLCWISSVPPAMR